MARLQMARNRQSADESRAVPAYTCVRHTACHALAMSIVDSIARTQQRRMTWVLAADEVIAKAKVTRHLQSRQTADT